MMEQCAEIHAHTSTCGHRFQNEQCIEKCSISCAEGIEIDGHTTLSCMGATHHHIVYNIAYSEPVHADKFDHARTDPEQPPG